ncbi:MAG: sugar ABC transporter permease [Clostridia bacterium]|nr:sugar ABC transporter permease [Clostridia bacterium]
MSKTKRKKHKSVWLPTKRDISAWILILPALLLIYLFVLRPQIMGTYWSFFDMKGYKVQEFVGLENYKTVISDSMFLKTLWNTFQYVLWSIVIGYFLPIIIAILLNELVHARNTYRVLIYFPSILPGAGVALLWYLMFYPDAGGLLNMIGQLFGMEPYVWLQDSRWTIMYIVISMTWSGCGSSVIYYFAALQGVSRELYEAAIIDGAGFIRRIRTITLPHISGIALLFLVRQIIGVFSVMEQPLQMTDGGPNGASTTLGLLAYKYGFVSIKADLAMTVGVIMFIILAVITCFYFYLDKKIERQ